MEARTQTLWTLAVCPAQGVGRWMSGLVRALLGTACFAVVLGVGTSSVHAQEGMAREAPVSLPGFIFNPLYASNQGSVYGIYEARHADLVLLEGGFDSGFTTGMVCRIASGEEEIGEVMLVEVRNNCSAAVILELEPEQVIEPGHSVRIKTVKF